MPHDITSYVLHEELLSDHRFDNKRSGEGSVVSLANGDLLCVYGAFAGGADHDQATLVQRISSNHGKTWSAPAVFTPTPPNCLNQMSASLLSLQSGRIAGMFLRKQTRDDCRPCFMSASPKAQDWSSPAPMIEKPGYYVINNDRLIQLNSGRLLAPYALHDTSGESFSSRCGCVFSDDEGVSWHLSNKEISIEPENIKQPQALDNYFPEVWQRILEGKVECQEPGVIELSNGKVMMWCRSNGGYSYRAYSDDGGDTWSSFKAIPEFAMPNSPQSIKRLPGNQRLIMLFNDHNHIPLGHPQWHWRRPLTVAVSDDDGQTWRRHGLLEPDSIPSNCYYSICFHKNQVVFTYYEGVMHTSKTGFYMPRNLASCKLKVVAQKYFEL